jgi:peptidyl-prolyl cis-trans isomerase SurA
MKILKSLITIALLTVVCTSGALAAGIMLDRVVAVVNDEAITWGELYKAMEFEMAKEMRSLSVEQKKAVFEENEAMFLENMINTKLQLQEARKFGITVSERDMDAAVQGIQKKYQLGDEEYLKIVRDEGFTMEEYRERLGEQMIIGRLLEMAVRSKIVITDEDLQGAPPGDAFYRLRQIFFKDKPGAQDRADAVMDELEAGADFAKLALKHSEGPLTSAGGDLGFVQKSKMISEFASALEGLSPGQFSQPFRTAKGLHIIKFEQVRGIREVLSEEHFSEAYVDWLRGLREMAFIEIRL